MLRLLRAPACRVAATLLLVGGTLSLAGCSNAGEGLARTFGFTRESPDEFAVTTQPPLSMPPDYAIRPPQPGASRPQAVSDTRQAEEALIPQTALGATGGTGGMSAGQQALIQQAGPPAPAGIRNEVDQEAAKSASGQSFADRLMFWQTPEPSGIVVDPQKEAKRLREDAALGKSPLVGETPIIQPKPRGWFEGIF